LNDEKKDPVIRIAGTPNGLAHHKTFGYHQINRVRWHIDVPDRSEINFEVIVMAVNVMCIDSLGVERFTKCFFYPNTITTPSIDLLNKCNLAVYEA
jgi:hypothetical protein